MCVHETVRQWYLQALSNLQMPGDTWNFPEAHGLLNSLTYPKNQRWVVNLDLSTLCAHPSSSEKAVIRPRGLGDFDKVFDQVAAKGVSNTAAVVPQHTTPDVLLLPHLVPSRPGNIQTFHLSNTFTDGSAFENSQPLQADFPLRLQLMYSFPEDQQWLAAAATYGNTTIRDGGIHVFIDYSNISIGYMQKVMQRRHAARNRSDFSRMNIRFSFESLVLLLERGRPVAKRVLAGSTPHDPAIAKAKAIGYDVHMLEKVYKDEGVKERDRRTAALASPYNGSFRGLHSQNTFRDANALPTTGFPTQSRAWSNFGVSERLASRLAEYLPITPPTSTDSSPDRTGIAPPKSNGRWVEQAVDEILHSKIYESVIDAAVPSTIVLATGDGATAEFSDGFVAAVERALNRGWKVELVAWKKTTNYHWRSRVWQERWGERFKIIELDGWEGFLEEGGP